MRLGCDGEPLISADARVQAFDWWVDWAGPDAQGAEHAARTALREVVGLTATEDLPDSLARLEDEVRRVLVLRGDEVGTVSVTLGVLPDRGSGEVSPAETGNPLGHARLAGPVVVLPVGHAGVLRGRQLTPGLSLVLPGRVRRVDLREHVVSAEDASAWYQVTDPVAAAASGIADLELAIGELLRTVTAAASEAEVRDALDDATTAWGVRVNRVSIDRGASASTTSVPEGSRP